MTPQGPQNQFSKSQGNAQYQPSFNAARQQKESPRMSLHQDNQGKLDQSNLSRGPQQPQRLVQQANRQYAAKPTAEDEIDELRAMNQGRSGGTRDQSYMGRGAINEDQAKGIQSFYIHTEKHGIIIYRMVPSNSNGIILRARLENIDGTVQ